MITVLLMYSTSVWSTTYYVSPSGDNKNSGISKAQPFRVVQYAIDKMQTGDRLIVLDGFYSSNKPLKLKSGITIQAMNPRRAIFSNLKKVQGTFLKHTGAIWKLKINEHPKQVFYNDQPMTWARWPNCNWSGNWDAHKKWANATAGTGPGVLTSKAFNELSPNLKLKGGYCFIRYGKGNSCYSRLIESFDGKILKWNDDNFYDKKYTGEDGPRGAPGFYEKIKERSPIHPSKSKFFLAGRLCLLDAPGEWFEENGILYFYPPDGKKPSPSRLLIKTADYCIDEGTLKDVTIDGIDFVGTSVRISDGNGIVFRNVQFKYIGGELLYIDRVYGKTKANKPVQLTGQNFLLDTCLFAGAQNAALSLEGSDITVTNCVFMENNRNANFKSRAMELIPNGKFTVTGCTFFNNGSDSILFHWHRTTRGRNFSNSCIAYNNIFNSGIYNTDVSGIYMPTRSQRFMQIHHNWVHNINGNAVRLDLAGSELSIHHNCFWGSKRGLNIEGYGHFNLYNNTDVLNKEDSCLVRNVITDRRILAQNAIHPSHTGNIKSNFPPIEDWNVLNNLFDGMVDRIAVREKPLYKISDLHPERKKTRNGVISLRNRGSIQGNLFNVPHNIFTGGDLSRLNLVPKDPVVRKSVVKQTRKLEEQHVTALTPFKGAYDLRVKPGKGLWIPGSNWLPNGLKTLKTMAESETFAKKYRNRSIIPAFDTKHLPHGALSLKIQ